ncbi:MAG: ABC transporter substrate-binding protein [Acidimicrobiia bacterium]
MSSSRFVRLVALAGVVVFALGACSGSSGSGGKASDGASSGSGGSNLCPVSALAKASGPVTITFWHGLNRANEETLQKLVDQFNGQQTKVKVNLVNQTGYEEILRKWVAGLGTNELPDLAQMEDTATQQMIDTQSIVPVADCIKADHYDTSDFVGRVLERYNVDGKLYPMPFNVSNPVLYYDKNAYRAAGLDPEKPPTTLAEVKTDAAKIKALGYQTGFGLKLNPWYLEQWASKADHLFVDHENGRKGRATKVLFDDEAGQATFAWMKDMVDSGLARTNPDSGPNAFDNLLGIRSKVQGMTIDSSASLGTVSQVLASGEGGGVELGVGPMPGPTGAGGVLVGGGALYMSKTSTPEKIAATWEFVKFLVSAQTQATFAAGTGYVPIRKSSVNEKVLADLYASTPGYKVAYDQLLSGKDDVATAGPVIGNYAGVRDVVRDAETKMLAENGDPKAAIKAAAIAATAAIQDYNTRIGK